MRCVGKGEQKLGCPVCRLFAEFSMRVSFRLVSRLAKCISPCWIPSPLPLAEGWGELPLVQAQQKRGHWWFQLCACLALALAGILSFGNIRHWSSRSHRGWESPCARTAPAGQRRGRGLEPRGAARPRAVGCGSRRCVAVGPGRLWVCSAERSDGGCKVSRSLLPCCAGVTAGFGFAAVGSTRGIKQRAFFVYV